jgi:Fic family protein
MKRWSVQSFKPEYLEKLALSVPTAWLLSQCSEFKGKQDLLLKSQTDFMTQLKSMAKIQSVESSNRIEGVITSRDRLGPLLAEKIPPASRPEEEILGYKKAVEWIHTHYLDLPINSDTVAKLHKISQGGYGRKSPFLLGLPEDAGFFKSKDNEIIEILDNGERNIRFIPVSAKDTPHYMEQLCLAYRDSETKKTLPDLVLIANFIFDFLCIHPFRDGNGRVSRLLTLLLLYKADFKIGSFISLERLIETYKEEYYRALHLSSQKWHQGAHDLTPWHQFFFSIIKEAYVEFKSRVEMNQPHQGKRYLIRHTVLEFAEPFSLSQVCAKLPNISESMIRKVLQEMKISKEVKMTGKGRGAIWRPVFKDRRIDRV